ncbi:MAG: metallophosphoesterase [Candidatus Izemoplasmatales bacterium]|nr:metallophosphoesterase [Candidatus Izemoplasmatales bacterium]
MKKIVLMICMLLILSLGACSNQKSIEYSDDTPIVVEMENEELKILQLTDLHLTYGIDANDRKTFALIKKLVSSAEWDLVVLSGDMTMSSLGPSLFKRLVRTMEDLLVPWTFVFGNHETDYHSYEDYLAYTENTEYLLFKTGPELEGGGVGNFAIEFQKDGVPFYLVYLLDSHAERNEYTEAEGKYDYLAETQVDWYEQNVQDDVVDSIMFMHIPLRQFVLLETDPLIDYTGVLEEKVCPQGIDTGMFSAITTWEKTKGVFVGHDHLNDTVFTLDGVVLGYGRASGYNGYGDLERGGRVVEIDSDQIMTTYVLLESEVSS